jgi:serine carboxypeptidase-like clade II
VQIGNGILELKEEQRTMYDFLWQRAFISDSAHALIAQSCKNADDNSPVCNAAETAAENQLGNIDYLNIYGTKCYDKKVKPTASNCLVYSSSLVYRPFTGALFIIV